MEEKVFTVLDIDYVDKIGLNTIILKDVDGNLPKIAAGQFMMVGMRENNVKLLLRPYTIAEVDYKQSTVTILVEIRGAGSRRLVEECQRIMCLKESQRYVRDLPNTIRGILPLGRGWTIKDIEKGERILIVSGGAGRASVGYLREELEKKGIETYILMGMKGITKEGKKIKEEDRIYITTEDGSLGFKGRVTDHPMLEGKFDRVYACGPRGMLRALTEKIGRRAPLMEVSLDNIMLCGVGVCLCCAEKLTDGRNVRVCKEGPVFNVKELGWI
ncbi:MAG: hypothetical protein LBU03_03540 [Tannerellaceae bacterium]|jgi:dihydroorotate dehydrogenase electron transfer subunit|nr:hypothetical protein [Tannerellaceae bacterium]